MTYRTLLDEVLARETTTGYQGERDLIKAKELVGRLDADKAKKLWSDGVSRLKTGEFRKWCSMLEDQGLKVLITNHTIPIQSAKLESIEFRVLPGQTRSEPGLVFVVS